MRVAVFEWLCGGGMHGQSVENIPPSLLREGWAMLFTLAKNLHSANHDAITVLDHRIVSDPQSATLPAKFLRFEDYLENISDSSIDCTITAWQKFFFDSGAELALIIAPEIDGILQRTIAAFQSSRSPLRNCPGSLLDRTCDKWLTAVRLMHAGIPHPPTQLASYWLATRHEAAKRWCLKSRLGAGCEGMLIGSTKDLASKIASLSDSTRWIVQPWLPGDAYSCSAIVDRSGQAHWLPLVTQNFEFLPSGNLQELHYLGGKLVQRPTGPSDIGPSPPQALLNELLLTLCDSSQEALGWVGVDLLLEASGRWVVVEVNPRITTSILGLSQAAPFNLVKSMINACFGVENAYFCLPSGSWKNVEFTPACL